MTVEKSIPDLTGISERLNALHQELLVGIALGDSLSNVMTAFCRGIEALAPDVVCSVIGVDDDGRMRPIAGPSLPESYAEAISGIQVGPDVGSCGTAIYLRTAIEVCDIETDPLWAPYKSLALPYGLHACWSCPIQSQDGRVLGAFGLYFREKRYSNAFERRIVAECLNFCAIAIANSEARARLNNLAFFDPLTGLGNRATLENRLPLILQRANERQHSVTIYHIDIAEFQAINDLHGRIHGDMTLARVGHLLRSVAADSDLIVRTGGDQFLVVKSARKEDFDPEEFAQDIVHGIYGGHRLDSGEEVMIDVRVGLASFPADGRQQDELLEHAETALRRAKRSGRTHVKFEPRMEYEKRQRRSLERDIKLAIERRELSLVFQPQVDAKSGAIQAFEALVRWTHSELGPISPVQFIPIAEGNGAIHAIGEFVLTRACEEAARWNEKMRVAVNVSAAQIVRNDFVQLVANVLSQTNLDPARLELEVTESLFVQDLTTATATLRRLKRLGVSVAMDDFGTGYSSLSTLRAFPFDRIKVDRSFVSDMVHSPDAAAIVNSVVGLGRTMGLRVVAEGVESQEQVAMLRLIGCHEIQGYLFGKPLPAESYEHVTRPSPRAAAAKKRASRATHANSTR
ncbi:GGDEF domain-containing protein [Hyphomicrobium sp.]|uniref:bifunctional diguanylate cyclase/phosphodiesterase n=1 Tax=Hyphomicrobium sp. TaxID=82 RepID=UPI000FB7C1FA|nr:GGDEF domain-containing protein [Hyphomicrobium sp.]RUP00407.1 MAG: phosphodiesterase [Hyphomicrobium sp.]